MAYTYSAFVSVMNKDGRSTNFSSAPTITAIDGGTASVIVAPVPTITNLTTGLYKLELANYATMTDVLWKVVPPAADLATLQDLACLQGKIEQTVDERIDAAISTRSTLTAAQVWSNVTRTLTMTAAQVVAALAGNGITHVNRTTFGATLTGLTIPSDWASILLTVKSSKRLGDDRATLQIVVSNPAAGTTDGVKYYLGDEADATERLYGSLTVDQSGGTVTIAIQDNADFRAVIGAQHGYDIKVIRAGSTSELLAGSGRWTWTETETRTI
jgi:hypothetical protein